MLVFMMYRMALWERVDLLSKLQCQFCFVLFCFVLIHQPPAIAYRVKLKTF